MELQFHLDFQSQITFLYSNSRTQRGSWQTVDLFSTRADKYHYSFCQCSGWEREGNTQALLRSRDCHRAVLLPFVSGTVNRAAVQRQRVFITTRSSRAGLQGTVLRRIPLPARTQGFCSAAFYTHIWESNGKGQQTINHLSRRYLSATLK